ncbi:class I SAM-dependent methyltransferase [Candidatus Protochlamydia phocaeensis]|uniref:class I SAM-dependent methyltransferase n=1 Tax=Candidatus Protochlamydia phocaeensis TaxID=1414722 RepID=UPI000837C243|nr:class I SAM-dependent methyltransferase [Candidatus Protochlamydia phocaeensis]
MYWFLSLLLMAFVSQTSAFAHSQEFVDSTSYLADRIPSTDKRYASLKLALDLMSQRQAKIVVETGTARCGAQGFIGDGSATLIFGEWALDHGSLLYSVDINPDAITAARMSIGPYNPNVQLVCQDSIAFLSQFNQSIDFLYLDSFDYDIFNPGPSQEHHLKEILAVYPKLTDNSVIMIDDCDVPGGGKGALVIPYLIDKGWKVLYSGYQVILIKN